MQRVLVKIPFLSDLMAAVYVCMCVCMCVHVCACVCMCLGHMGWDFCIYIWAQGALYICKCVHIHKDSGGIR